MIIITGATGFIGSNLVADFNQLGQTDLVLVDELGTTGKWKNIAKHRFLDIIHPRDVATFLKDAGPAQAVFHMGANSSTTATDGDEILESNLHSSMRWWQWCARTGTPLIYASSAATYGNGEHGFDDEQSAQALDRLRPLNLYGWSKHAFDKWAVDQAAAGNAPPHWAGLKFFNVYGPNEHHKGDMRSLVAKNTLRIAQGETLQLFKSHRADYADGAQLRDFIYVKDCCAAMRWLMETPTTKGVFNLGTGQARSFVDLMQAIGKALGKPVNIEFIDMPEAIRPNYQYFTQASMDKLRSAGFSAPFHSIEQGVLDYVQNYLMQADSYR
ncbi:MAG: ADP-glyceromanno-heptose 6-epimerase [Pseudomonadota bacterium]